ncbi:MAG: hypothetical protein JWP91_1850 [Fibrobacteres bacterium]|nr:hypothetical protein [Fibrobacterota bacterium]
MQSKTLFSAISVSLLCGTAALGQTYNLKGRVLDKVGMKPVAGAIVEINGGSLKATTDSAGRFTLQGATGLSGLPDAAFAAPYFRDGILFVEAGKSVRSAKVELFGLAGEAISTAEYPLTDAGWNRLQVLPRQGRDFFGFARITAGGESWVKRVLHLDAPSALQWAGDAAPATVSSKSARAMAKAAAAGSLDVSADRLVKKSVRFASDNADLGDIVLDYPPRKLDVGAPPIYGAVTLFDGSKGKAAAQAELKAKWKDWPRFSPSEIMFKIAKDPQFPDDTNKVTLQSCCNTQWGYDDIQALSVHGDAQIHVEFNGMGEYDATEKTNAGDAIDENPVKPGYYNSGVYLQSRYEVQIRAFSQDKNVLPGSHDQAALVDDYSASANVNRPNGQWQAYDITFRTARYDGAGKKLENARVSMWWNGVQVHNNRDAKAPATGIDPSKHSGEELNPTLYGLKLQSEGRDVRFRNIWIKDLSIQDAQTNFGY